MEYKVEIKNIKEHGEKHFIVYGRELIFDHNDVDSQFEMWDECNSNGIIEQLKNIGKTDVVYTIYCNKFCPKTQKISNHIGCEVKKDFVCSDNKFEKLSLYPYDYAVFKIESNGITRKEAFIELLDIVWGD